MITVEVPLGDRTDPVLVGDGASTALATMIPPGVGRVAIVTQPPVGLQVDPGVEHRTWTIPDGEPAKTMATVEWLCGEWSAWGLTRRDAVVAVGGGVVTDTAGFAAAVYQRGVPVVHVATTLLAQVDAAIGGKTGVNIPEGKNLVGAFWQPSGVVCDTAVLRTLPPEEFRSGCGEMAKYHFLDGFPDDLELPDKVARCVEIKAAFVAADEREGGRRALLNYGHTLAHALETATGYELRHGEAVAVGLVFAARLAERLGRIGAARVAEHVRVVGSYDLPTQIPSGLDPAELVQIMKRDKKAVRGITFVLDGPSGVEVVAGVDEETVKSLL